MLYPKSDATERIYRLWDPQKKEQMRWRYYKDVKKAHMGALIEARWAKVGHTIEVYNSQTGHLVKDGQYTRTANSVRISDNK